MEDKEEEEEATAKEIEALVRKEVEDWDDEDKVRSRFKALNGQRSDWEPLYLFWRDLILKVARHLRIFIIRHSHLKRFWFRRSGLTPLCLDRVLLEMHRAGDLILLPTSSATTTTLLSHFFRKALNFLGATTTNRYDTLAFSGDYYILAPLLQEQSLKVLNILSENHWTTSCIITMRKFQDICFGSKEALAILGYLSENGRARLITIKRADDVIEGVKVCLAPAAVSSASSTDYSVLHLIWTIEKLEKQLGLIDQQYQK